MRPHRGVLAVSPDQRSSAVLLGITLLALLVALATVGAGVLRWGADGAFDAPEESCYAGDPLSAPC